VELTEALPLDVDPSILIPGNDLPTVRTNPLLLAELQLAEVASTMAAGLAGGIPFIMCAVKPRALALGI